MRASGEERGRGAGDRVDWEARRGTPPAWEPEVWVQEDGGRSEQGTSGSGQGRPGQARPAGGRRPARLAPEVAAELDGAGEPRLVPRLGERLSEAARAYERDRYLDALRLLRTLAKAAPGAPAVRELYGLTLYRLGRWEEAIGQLEAYRRLSGSLDQLPVVADCHRALGHYRQAEEAWDELRLSSPAPDVLAEGRLVMAGARADQGDVRGAIALLSRVSRQVRAPRPHHLRQWYALADLYERSGDLPRARQLFDLVARHDRQLADVTERLAGLG